MDSSSSDVDSDTGSSLTDFAAQSSVSSPDFSSESDCNMQVTSERKRRRITGSEGTAAKNWFRAKKLQSERLFFSSTEDREERLEALDLLSLKHKLRSNPKSALKNIG